MNKNQENDTKILKDKVVEFPLSREMKLPDLTKKGYQRHEVVALFEELAKNGMGIYTGGSRGKGNCAFFEFWQDHPETYSMTFKVEKLHSDYAGKPLKMTPEPPRRFAQPAANAPETAVNEPPATSSSVSGARRTSLTASRYRVAVNESGLFVELVDKGYSCIEDALANVWGSIKDKVKEPHYNEMTPLEAVASKLLGRGSYSF